MALVTEQPDDTPSTITEPPRQSKALTLPSFDSAKIKITGGMSDESLDNPPDRDDKRTYVVETVCVDHEIKNIDGEPRLVCSMQQTSIYERGRVPIVDEGRPKALFDFVSDDQLWEQARDTAFERGEVIDDVITDFLRDYVTAGNADGSETASSGDADTAQEQLDVDTKTDGDKVLRPAFSHSKKETDE